MKRLFAPIVGMAMVMCMSCTCAYAEECYNGCYYSDYEDTYNYGSDYYNDYENYDFGDYSDYENYDFGDYSDYEDYDFDDYSDYENYDFDDYSDYENYDFDDYSDYENYDFDDYSDFESYDTGDYQDDYSYDSIYYSNDDEYDYDYEFSDYIIVDINSQTIELYKDYQLIVAGMVVTGQLGACDTPKGSYSIISKYEELYINENAYVKFWMPFYGDYGLHDADNWRNNYGGDIYANNGSHGCVNMSEEIAREIYDNSYVGMKVIVE